MAARPLGQLCSIVAIESPLYKGVSCSNLGHVEAALRYAHARFVKAYEERHAHLAPVAAGRPPTRAPPCSLVT